MASTTERPATEGIEQEVLWHPLAPLGITDAHAAVSAPVLINTWIVLGVLLILIMIARACLRMHNSLGAYLVKSIIKSFKQLIEQSVGTFVYRYYLFIGSLFIYIITCNMIALIPYVEEPTKDLNTTLALGIIAFLFVQKEIIATHGLPAYLKEYFAPINIFFPLNILIGFALLPLKLLSEGASIISLAFRLFGNIFGGAIIIGIFRKALGNSLLFNSIGTFLGFNLLLTGFFIIFEAFLQAFVFSILTLTNITMATSLEEGRH
jgi:F-type H+-transporting ATPase subunit a